MTSLPRDKHKAKEDEQPLSAVEPPFYSLWHF
jgi:hypothetical protein